MTASSRGFLTYPQFKEQCLEVLMTQEYFGISASDATIKKIASLSLLHEELEVLKTSGASNPVKLRKVQDQITRIMQIVSQAHDELIEDSYAIYQNAILAPLPFVIGSSELRTTSCALELMNFGTLSSGDPAIPSGLVRTLPSIEQGSIFAPKPWKQLKNDAFILGAIHSRHTFYLSSPLEEGAFWDKSTDKLRTLGREVVMLDAASYVQVASPEQAAKYGATFVCFYPEESEAITLKDLLRKVDKVRCFSYLEEIFFRARPRASTVEP